MPRELPVGKPIIDNQLGLLEAWHEYFGDLTVVHYSEDSLIVDLIDGRMIRVP
jgi:hypothetical protein